jgi:hypothetical protein
MRNLVGLLVGGGLIGNMVVLRIVVGEVGSIRVGVLVGV